MRFLDFHQCINVTYINGCLVKVGLIKKLCQSNVYRFVNLSAFVRLILINCCVSLSDAYLLVFWVRIIY